jgi:hypothetical protein
MMSAFAALTSMTLRRRWTTATALGVAVSALSFVLPARAQTHWDVGAQVGVTERVATAAGAPARSPGPAVEVHGHIAVYPMVRVGAYGTFDLSPTSGWPDRTVYAAGGRIKVSPPWLPAAWHLWAFLGVGFADAVIPRWGLSTSTVEIPAGIGLGRKLSGPWELCAELSARLDVAGLSWHGGPPPGPPVSADNASGGDVLAVSLSVGVSLAP